MSEVTKDKAFDRAVDLVINQDHIIQQWAGRYIAIQAGLAAALATLLSWKSSELGFAVVILAVLIGGIAIILTHAMTQIIKREYEWQKKYVEMVKRIEGKDPLLYQDIGNYEPLPGKDIPSVFEQIRPYIIGAWFIVVLLTIFLVILPLCRC